MGNIMEKGNWQNRSMGCMAMGKCKGYQTKYFHVQTNYKHFQGGYGGQQFSYVYKFNGLFQRTCKFKESSSKTFFH